MRKSLDLMETAFKMISDKIELIISEEFMMSVFSPLVDRLPSIKCYLTHMFEEMEASALRSCAEKDCWLPYDELIAHFFPLQSISCNPMAQLANWRHWLHLHSY